MIQESKLQQCTFFVLVHKIQVLPIAAKDLRLVAKVLLYSVLSYGRIQSFNSDIFLKVKFSISL